MSLQKVVQHTLFLLQTIAVEIILSYIIYSVEYQKCYWISIILLVLYCDNASVDVFITFIFKVKLIDSLHFKQQGKLAKELDFVSHHVRTRLDELKRQEVNRLRMLIKAKQDQEGGGGMYSTIQQTAPLMVVWRWRMCVRAAHNPGTSIRSFTCCREMCRVVNNGAVLHPSGRCFAVINTPNISSFTFWIAAIVLPLGWVILKNIYVLDFNF